MNPLLSILQHLELELHHPGVKCTQARLEQLLHPQFHEVGRSGYPYTRATVIEYLVDAAQLAVVSDQFAVAVLAPGVALLTYRSALLEQGKLVNHTLRSSVWVQVGQDWCLRYHQGTPAGIPW